MLNSKQFKLAKKYAEMMARIDAPIIFAVEGIIGDVRAQTYADGEMLIPMWGPGGTIGAVRAMPHWDTDAKVLDQLVASVQGRMARFYITEHAGIALEGASLEQAANIMEVTNAQQERILKGMVGEEAYAAYKLEQGKQLMEIVSTMANQGSVKF